ncbi:unnamed protein product, partial [Ectocarpus fasciculatus]
SGPLRLRAPPCSPVLCACRQLQSTSPASSSLRHRAVRAPPLGLHLVLPPVARVKRAALAGRGPLQQRRVPPDQRPVLPVVPSRSVVKPNCWAIFAGSTARAYQIARELSAATELNQISDRVITAVKFYRHHGLSGCSGQRRGGC